MGGAGTSHIKQHADTGSRDWEEECKYALSGCQCTRVLQSSPMTNIQGRVFTGTQEDLHSLFGHKADFVFQHANNDTIPPWDEVQSGLDIFIPRLARSTKVIHFCILFVNIIQKSPSKRHHG